jgi:hypothetical protein
MDVTIRTVEAVLRETAGERVLDLREAGDVDPYALLLLDLAAHAWHGRRTIRWPERGDARGWIRAMGLLDDVPGGGRLRTGSRIPAALQPITSIGNEEGIREVIERFGDALAAHYPLSEGSQRSLIAIMFELFQNIPHHSNATGDVDDAHGIAAMQEYADSIFLVVGDIGIGIGRSLGLHEGFRDLTDEEALERVVLDGVSRHGDPGRGGELRKIARLVRMWEGEFIVRSGSSLFAAHEDTFGFYDVVSFPGVQIAVRLPRALLETAPVECDAEKAFNGRDESS